MRGRKARTNNCRSTSTSASLHFANISPFKYLWVRFSERMYYWGGNCTFPPQRPACGWRGVNGVTTVHPRGRSLQRHGGGAGTKTKRRGQVRLPPPTPPPADVAGHPEPSGVRKSQKGLTHRKWNRAWPSHHKINPDKKTIQFDLRTSDPSPAFHYELFHSLKLLRGVLAMVSRRALTRPQPPAMQGAGAPPPPWGRPISTSLRGSKTVVCAPGP